MQLTSEHLQALHETAMRYCRRDRAAADDLVQDTCERAWQKLDSLHDESRLFPWLKRILRNCWIDVCRKKSNVIPVADVPDQPIPTDDPAPWQQVTVDDFRDALEQLREPYRSVAILHYVDRCSNTDIAQQLSIPYPTAATRLCRAREKLREFLQARLNRDEVD